MGGVVLQNEQTGMLGLQLAVDALQNGHNLRHHGTQQVQIPLLQSLGHDGVVGIGEGPLGDGEALLEGHALGHQQADQLGNGNGGMGIVELNGHKIRQAAQVGAMGFLINPQNILQGGGGKHILLLHTEPLALPGGVVGVQHPGDVLGLVLGVQGTLVILGVEGVEVQLLLGLALPQPQGADVFGAVADDGHIVGNRQHVVIGEGNLHRMIVAAVGPGIAELAPVVCGLLLAAVFVKLLLEQAETVAQAVAGQGDVAGHGGVQEAGGQAAQTAVAQGGVLDLLQASQVHPGCLEGLLQLIQDAQVVEVAVHQAANEIFRGEIVGPAAVGAAALGGAPVLADGHHDRLGQRLMQGLGRGLPQSDVILVSKLGFRHFQYILAIQTHKLTPSLGMGDKVVSDPTKAFGHGIYFFRQGVGENAVLGAPGPVVA